MADDETWINAGDRDQKQPHEPVLPQQVLGVLRPAAGQVMLDCTAGLGGHAALITTLLAPGGRYIGLDVDPQNTALAKDRLATAPVPVDLLTANFASARNALDRLGIDRVDLLLADLGFASNQMADPARGLSFRHNGPLDMRLDPTLGHTAADLINQLPEKELADLIYRNSQERLSRKIARKIIESRRRSPINTTAGLAQVVREAYGRIGHSRHGPKAKTIDPATRTFMALRIAVNAELLALEQLLASMPNLLNPGAVAAVISFHSLEDRLVKQAWARLCTAGHAQPVTAKPIVADEQERKHNPSSRSAKLRAIRWVGQHKSQ